MIAAVAVADHDDTFHSHFNGSVNTYDGETVTGVNANALSHWWADLSSLYPCSYSFDEDHTWSYHIAAYKTAANDD